MAEHVYIQDISAHLGQEVTIKGWLYNIRSSGKLKFPQIRDGSGIVQGVVSKRDVSEQVWNDFDGLTQPAQPPLCSRRRNPLPLLPPHQPVHRAPQPRLQSGPHRAPAAIELIHEVPGQLRRQAQPLLPER